MKRMMKWRKPSSVFAVFALLILVSIIQCYFSSRSQYVRLFSSESIVNLNDITRDAAPLMTTVELVESIFSSSLAQIAHPTRLQESFLWKYDNIAFSELTNRSDSASLMLEVYRRMFHEEFIPSEYPVNLFTLRFIKISICLSRIAGNH